MRRLASFLLLGFVLTAGAAEIWRWKDANGSWHYSDSPVPGAERIEVHAARPGTPATPPPVAYSSPAAAPAPAVEPYTRCAVMQPANDATLQAADAVSVSLDIEPGLQPRHRVHVFLNGSRYDEWPEAFITHTLGTMPRGSYTLAVRILDASGVVLCNGPVSNFHVRQPSVLSPLRRPAPN
jgi:hypothetical protein